MTLDPGLPPAPGPIDYVRRWAQLVERRRAQMDAAFAAAGQSSGDYWARRAKAYRQSLHERMDEDPFFLSVRAATDAQSSVLDVGAGTGRHTLALAPHVRRVTAVDPSPAMLGLLREDVAAQRFGNVEAVEAEWMAAEVEAADFVICSHVLYPIAEVVPFVRKLEEKARERVFIYLRADPLPTDLGLWGEFYGVPLQHQPVHMDLINVLAQIGVFADVEVVSHRFTLTYGSIDEAVEQLRYGLCLRDGDAAAGARLRELLEERLVRWPNGRVGPSIESARSAIMSWQPAR
ncbi:MAG TPA: class I SAM-dependent methyltransferase [Dehalococcoidia bacterium]|nr:class I SAM-dependent methyltransferase [Dehalococcoidia bacterium]